MARHSHDMALTLRGSQTVWLSHVTARTRLDTYTAWHSHDKGLT